MTPCEDSWRDKPSTIAAELPYRLWRWSWHWGDLLVALGFALLLRNGAATGRVSPPEDAVTTPAIAVVQTAHNSPEQTLDGVGAPRRIVLLADLSASMGEPASAASVSPSKWDLVRLGIGKFLDDLPGESVVGVRVFGHSGVQCGPSEMLRAPAPLGTSGAAEIEGKLGQLAPQGDTPLAHALGAAAADLGPLGGQVILLSDGMDSCVGVEQLCAAAKAVAARGTPVRIDLVRAFVPEDARQALACIPDATGGLVLDFLGGDPTVLTALLWRTLPLRVGVALLLIVLGAVTLFELCELLAEALGGLHVVWGRAGFAADLTFAVLAGGWAAYWLLYAARLPIALALALVGAVLIFLFREIPRQRAAKSS